MHVARQLWLRLETVHAVTYFGQETTDAVAATGVGGFWAGYFALRAAPLGPVEPGVIEAAFFGFAPRFVRRWVPDVWSRVTPAELVALRARAAAATLRRVAPDIDRVAAAVDPLLRRATAGAVPGGRPLFAANRDLQPPQDPVERLWHWTTCLREHRGDGHVAALTTAGFDGLTAHVLLVAEEGSSAEDRQRTRGWSADDWERAVERCRARGWVDADGELTDAGWRARADVEVATDRLADEPFEGIADDVLELLGPVAVAVAASGTIRYPNPMSLPPAHELIR